MYECLLYLSYNATSHTHSWNTHIVMIDPSSNSLWLNKLLAHELNNIIICVDVSYQGMRTEVAYWTGFNTVPIVFFFINIVLTKQLVSNAYNGTADVKMGSPFQC